MKCPLDIMPDIPLLPHAGAFGAKRKYDIHTGVDLYCQDGTEVKSIANGEIVLMGQFTGQAVFSPWWDDTYYVMVDHGFAVIVYGEVKKSILPRIAVGQRIREGQYLGSVARVLKNDKGLPTTMLHLECYEAEYRGEPVYWGLNQPMPHQLLDPTPLLKELCGNDIHSSRIANR